MAERGINVVVEGSMASLTLNRPDKRNAMTLDMWRDLRDACAELERDDRVKGVLVTGNGPSFCAGADVSALQEDEKTVKSAVAEAESALRRLSVPTVAAICGHCWGGGVQLAIACDLRIANETATFAVPPARLGVIYPAGSLRAMVALIGPSAAKRLLFSGDPIDAATALRLGLVDEVTRPGDAIATAERLLTSFEPRSLLSQAAAKAVVNACVDGADSGAVYSHYLNLWAGSDDATEGPAAFLDKRPADFSWHPASAP